MLAARCVKFWWLKAAVTAVHTRPDRSASMPTTACLFIWQWCGMGWGGRESDNAAKGSRVSCSSAS